MSHTYKTDPYRIRQFRLARLPVPRDWDVSWKHNRDRQKELDDLLESHGGGWGNPSMRGPRSGIEQFFRQRNNRRERRHVADRLAKRRYDHIESHHFFEGWY